MADDLYEYIEHDSLMFYTKDVLSLTFSKKLSVQMTDFHSLHTTKSRGDPV